VTDRFAHDTRALAETYERTSDLQLESGLALLDRLSLRPGEHVLDVGCGTGRLTRAMLARVSPGGTVTGVDPAGLRIELARRQESSVRFEVAGAEDLSLFADARFDAACLSSVLHWISDGARALREVRRVLRHGGRLGLTTMPHELSSEGTVSRVVRGVLERGGWTPTPGARGRTTSEVISLLLECGFEVLDVQVAPVDSVWPSGEEFVSFAEASAFGTLLSAVPERARATARASLVAALEAERGPSGVVVRTWNVSALARAR